MLAAVERAEDDGITTDGADATLALGAEVAATCAVAARTGADALVNIAEILDPFSAERDLAADIPPLERVGEVNAFDS